MIMIMVIIRITTTLMAVIITTMAPVTITTTITTEATIMGLAIRACSTAVQMPPANRSRA